MQEDFLHYVWKHKKLLKTNLETTLGEPIIIRSTGQHNLNAGPDFFNAQLKIGGQLWAGNVEIHIKSSDWFLHNHEQDKAYDNVILHVVWEHDTDVFRNNNEVMPTLELKHVVALELLGNYNALFNRKEKWINCETDFPSVDTFVLDNWLERLYFERLEQKAQYIQALLQNTKNDWETVCFIMLAKTFGLKVNGEAFFSVARSVDFSVVRKTQFNIMALEALLFGQAGLLESDVQNAYYQSLVSEYRFLKLKFGLTRTSVLPVQFFRLRPTNFPTIRLSQLANLYGRHQNLFSKLMETNTVTDFYTLFQVKASAFWNTHYTFETESKAMAKAISKPFVDLLLINTVLPLKFCYAKAKNNDTNTEILNTIQAIASEKNSIVDAFNNLKPVFKTAMESQALIQLKTEYCNKNKCLQCAVGNLVLSG